MKLILGISSDGYFACGPNDDMSWLDPMDKKIFRILTSVGGVCGVSAKTAESMPTLLGRRVQIISRQPGVGVSLGVFAGVNPNGWLLGGPKLARAALEEGLIDEAFTCISLGRNVPTADPQYKNDLFFEDYGLTNKGRIRMGEVLVEVWRKHGP